MLRYNSFKNRLIQLFLVNVIAILILMNQNISNLKQAWEQNTARLHNYSEAINLIKGFTAYELLIKDTVQTWKDLLIRGYNPEDLKTYNHNLAQMQAQSQNQLDILKRKSVSSTLKLENLSRLETIQNELWASYNQALAAHDLKEALAYRQIDALVRGMDKPLVKAILQLQDEVAEQSQAMISDETGKALLDQGLNRAYSVALGILVLNAIFSMFQVLAIINPLTLLKGIVEDLASEKTDLTRRIAYNGANELGDISASFNKFIEKIQCIIKGIHGNIEASQVVAQDLEAISLKVTETSAQQLAATQKTSNDITDIASTMNSVIATAHQAETESIAATNLASQANVSSKHSRDEAQEVSKLAQTLAEILNNLKARSLEMSNIVGVIKGVADQTNLLALNAAIEAARAGEQGRGFAVVADEVRALAKRAAAATGDINTQITNVLENVTEANVNILNQVKFTSASAAYSQSASQEIDTVGTYLQKINQVSQEIVIANTTQNSAVSEISNRLQSISNMSLNNAAVSDENANLSKKLIAALNRMSASTLSFKF